MNLRRERPAVLRLNINHVFVVDDFGCDCGRSISDLLLFPLAHDKENAANPSRDHVEAGDDFNEK